ncbi:MAG TPA: ABC transporter permease [Acidimicrobiales bacterium]|nr:ABC transporter permease [Acidimicrobiales bacterium]
MAIDAVVRGNVEEGGLTQASGELDAFIGPALWQRVIRHRVALIAAFDIVFIAVVGGLRPGFVSGANIVAMCDSMALPAIVLVPATMLLAAGRFDLSPDGVSAASGVVVGEMLSHLGHGDLMTAFAVAAGLATGLGFGLANGILVERVGINPLIATLGSWWVAAGIALGVEQGGNSFGLGAAFDSLGGTRAGGLLVEDWFAIPVLVIGGLLLAYRKSGAHIFATGGNREAARRNGIRIGRIVIRLYVASGVASALAGIVFASRLDSATTNPFNGLALQVIASAVIGGASLMGGKGTIAGAFLGLLLLQMITSATVFLAISPYWEQTITGAILLIAVYGDIQAAREGKGPSWLRAMVARAPKGSDR